MTTLLAMDAGTPQTVVVVGNAEAPTPAAVRAHVSKRGEPPASERLAEWISATLAEAGLSPRDVEAIVVGAGPGTFTGARVGVSTAKGFALGLGLDLHPVSTLEAVAMELDPSTMDDGAEILATLDARKGEIYGGWFRRSDAAGLESLAPEAVGEPQSFARKATGTTLVVGSGVQPYEAVFEGWGASLRPLPGVTPIGLWRAARVALQRPPVHTSALDVTYLRKSYAELGIHPPKRVYPKSPFV